MVSKDQALGALICIVCVVVAVLYFVALFFTEPVLSVLGASSLFEGLRYWLVAVPVFIAFTAILAIGAWIGWTMATTPPPKPIEEFELEKESEEETPKKAEPSEEKEEKK